MKRSPFLPASHLVRFVSTFAWLVVFLLAPVARAEIPGIELVMTEGIPLEDDPSLSLAYLPSTYFLQCSPQGHIVGTATVAGDGVTYANDNIAFYVPPGGALRILLREGGSYNSLDYGILPVTSLSDARLDQYGNVAVLTSFAHFTGDDSAILKGPPSSLELIALKGQPVGTNYSLGAVTGMKLTPSGKLLFHAPRGPWQTFWDDRPDAGADSMVLTEGVIYPGMPDEAYFRSFDYQVGYNNPGQLLFYGEMVRPIQPGSTSTTVDKGYWVYSAGGVSPVLLDGAPAPGLPGLTNVINEFRPPWIMDNGWAVLQTKVSGPGVTQDNDRVLYAGYGEALEVVAREGSPAPGTEDTFGDLFVVTQVREGEMMLFSNNGILWRWRNHSLKMLARSGQPLVSGDSQTVRFLQASALSPQGRTVIAASFQNPTETAIWIADGDQPARRLLGKGDAMPLPDGGTNAINSIWLVAGADVQGFDAQDRFLAILQPLSGPRSLAWIDPSVLLPPPAGTLSGTVFVDTDGDGDFSAADEGLGGVQVELYYADGSGHPFGDRLDVTETDGNGGYAFTDLDPANYILIELNLVGSVSVRDSQGTNDDRILVTLTAGQAAVGNNFLDRLLLPPEHVTLSLHQVVPDAVSNLEAGKSDAGFPIFPAVDRDLLAGLPEVNRGWVADGVTPLVLRATCLPEEVADGRTLRFRFTATQDSPVPGFLFVHLRHLFEDVWWTYDHFDYVAVEAAHPNGFAMIYPVKMDELASWPDTNAIKVTVVVEDCLTDQVLATRTIELRKPPVALVHDYGSDGTWGTPFREALGSKTRPFNEVDPQDNFIRTVRYGQKKDYELLGSLFNSIKFADNANFAKLNHQHTSFSLKRLVPLLHDALEQEMAPLHQDWAFTRCDVVAHGQGGVLIRRLASEVGTAAFPAYQSLTNCYRGRFHRIITIGSPHNGSRLFAYLRGFGHNQELVEYLPQEVVSLGIFSEAVQSKFDPFGDQIQEINSPATDNPWLPDPDAKFCLVASQVHPPNTHTWVALSRQLGLQSQAGPLVFPNGFDGIVDVKSMLADLDPTNAFNVVDVGRYLCHSAPEDLFTDNPDIPPVPQTESDDLGGFLRQRLNNSHFFDRFSLPPLLETTDKSSITNAAHKAIIGEWSAARNAIVPDSSSAAAAKKGEGIVHASDSQGVTYLFHLDAPRRLPGSDVLWSVEVFGPDGVTTEGVTVTNTPADPARVDVNVGDSVLGDVVLYAQYTTTNEQAAFGGPTIVVSRDPANSQIAEIAVIPPAGQYPPGEAITPQLLVAYSDGTVMQRYASADTLIAASSDDTVVDVSDPVYWKLLQPGQATVSVAYEGFFASSELTVRNESLTGQGVRIVAWTFDNDTFAVTVPRWDESELTLWRNEGLEASGWAEVTDAIVTQTGPETATLTDPQAGAQQSYYRVLATQP